MDEGNFRGPALKAGQPMLAPLCPIWLTPVCMEVGLIGRALNMPIFMPVLHGCVFPV